VLRHRCGCQRQYFVIFQSQSSTLAAGTLEVRRCFADGKAIQPDATPSDAANSLVSAILPLYETPPGVTDTPLYGLCESLCKCSTRGEGGLLSRCIGLARSSETFSDTLISALSGARSNVPPTCRIAMPYNPECRWGCEYLMKTQESNRARPLFLGRASSRYFYAFFQDNEVGCLAPGLKDTVRPVERWLCGADGAWPEVASQERLAIMLRIGN